jgi:carbamoyltransferase
LNNIKRKNIRHHHSHAAAGYYTSTFKSAAIVVIDAIGEWDTTSIWVGNDDKITCIEKHRYPFSFGLFYSAFTKLLGLKPNEEEYILMGMAAFGDPKKYYKQVSEYFPSIGKQKYNFHMGIHDWIIKEEDKFDIAAAVQKVYELRLIEFMRYVKKITGNSNLVFMGGCALNCAANTALWNIFDDIWIMPNPGDAGSSLGAAAALYGKHLNWKNPYLGQTIDNDYDIDKIIQTLLVDKVVPIASGRAEFGPRALGNRSLLADPRDPHIKDIVNKIKKREPFRPFAPIVLEEYAHEWFDMPTGSTPYMQYAIRCKRPNVIPSVVHADGTSRVQTLSYNNNNKLYTLLKEWHRITDVPVLLNTSLNIKGQPLINDENDILDWNSKYGYNIGWL